MKISEEEILDGFTEWSDTLISVGEGASDESGDSIPVLSAHLGVCYVAVNNGGINGMLLDDGAEDYLTHCQTMLQNYEHILPAVVSNLISSGWIEPAICEGCDCGSLIPMPTIPRCECCADQAQMERNRELLRELDDDA